jgi:hypothetical protein
VEWLDNGLRTAPQLIISHGDLALILHYITYNSMNTNTLNLFFFHVVFPVIRNNFDLIMGLLGHQRQPDMQLAEDGHGTAIDDEDPLLLSGSCMQYRTQEISCLEVSGFMDT